MGKGTGNVLTFQGNGVYRNCIFEFHGDNNTMEFGKNSNAESASFYIEDSDNHIQSGDRTNYAGKIHIACTEGRTISIGDGSLFSSEIVIRSGDSHSVLDLEGNRINEAKDVRIGNHVWVGHRVLINKGTVVPENCIIGTGAVLTKEYSEKNSVIAGVPAKVVKSGVNWTEKRI